MQSYFSCNLNGQCEIDNHSLSSEQECQETCQPLDGGEDAKEAAYLVMQYNLEQALEAAPSDRVQVIRRFTGVTISEYESWDAIWALVERDYHYLYHANIYHPPDNRPFRAYVLQFLDEFDILLLELVHAPDSAYNWEVLKRRVQWDFRKLFRGHEFATMFHILANEAVVVTSLEELTSLFKRQLGMIVYRWFQIQPFFDARQIEEVVNNHWAYLQREYGDQIPFQDMIQG